MKGGAASFRDLALRHGIAAAVGRLLSLATGALGIIVFARLLTKEDFARFTVLQTIVTFLSIVASFGLGQSALQLLGTKDAANKSFKQTIFRELGTIGLFSHLIVGLISIPIFVAIGPVFAGTVISIPIAICLSITVALRGIQSVYGEIARALNLTFLANMLTGLNGGAMHNGMTLLVMIVASAAFDLDWVTTVYATLVALLASIPVVGLLHVFEGSRAPQLDLTKTADPSSHSDGQINRAHLIKSSGLFAAIFLAIIICDQLDILLAGMLGSLEDASLYIAGKRIVMLLLIPLSVSNLAVMSLVPALYLGGAIDKLNRYLQAVAAATLVPSLVLCGIILVAPTTVIHYLLGSQYEQASVYLLILAPFQILVACTGSYNVVLFSIGRSKISLSLYTGTTLFLVALSPFVVNRYGLVGFAALVSILVGIRNALGSWIIYRYFGIATLPSFRELIVQLKFIRGRFASV